MIRFLTYGRPMASAGQRFRRGPAPTGTATRTKARTAACAAGSGTAPYDRVLYRGIRLGGPHGLLRLFFFLAALLSGIFGIPDPASAQTPEKKGYALGYIIEDRDTVYVDKIQPLYVFGRPRARRESKQWREYYRLIYNFKKTYPYALKAKQISQEADSVLATAGFNRREKEKYLKEYEKRLIKEFDKPLRNLTITQGKLLLKLIDREIGQTSYYVIRNYRGSAAAGFWQGIAKLFGSDLKKPYDKYGDDRQVEELVQMYHQGIFDYLYYSLYPR